jgi:hypothetical protein
VDLGGQPVAADIRDVSGVTSFNVVQDPLKLSETGAAEDEWVVSRGGEYFFTPSIAALEQFAAI